MYSNFPHKRGSLPSCWVDPCDSDYKDFTKKADFDIPVAYVAAATYPAPATYVPPSEPEEESIISALRSFASNTTAHGPRLITLSRSTSAWLSWAFIFLTAFCVVAAIFMAVEVTNIAFFSDKIESTIRMERAPKEGKPLPTVVLCNAGIFDDKAADALELDREMLSYIVASMLGPLFITKDFEKDTVRRTSLDAALRPVLARHGNMTQLITKLSYRCEDLIMQCYNIMFTLPGPQCCQKLFRSTITPIGVCYRSAFDSHFTQVMPGEGMGINIDLHVPLHTEADLDWSILKENLHTVSGLQISIINSISIPSLKVLGERVVIQPNTKVSVAVDHSVTNNVEATRGLWPFAPPTCTPTTAPPTELLKTMRNCFLYKLYLRFSEGNCSILATQRFMTDQLPVCTIEEQLTASERGIQSGKHDAAMVKDEDLCNLVCEDEDFISRVIIQPLSSQASRDPSGDDPFPRERKAVVAVFYPTLSHQVTLQSKPNIEYWFSKLGGDLGMCVGASVITIIEVILFLLYLLLLLLKKLARGISSLLAS